MNFSIILFNFRLFEYNEFKFNQNTIFINGKNKSGKSSLLEALYILKTGKSYRTYSLNNCIKNGQNFFSIEINNKNSEKIIYTDQGVKSYFIDNIKLKHNLINNQIFILYNKNIFNFIFYRDFRRKTIDELISFQDKKYLFYLINYRKLFDKKKEIIYSAFDLNTKKDLYQTLIDNISEYTDYIVNKRKNIVEECNNFLKNYNQYAINFYSYFLNKSINEIKQLYYKNFENEIIQKKYIGPHNDYYILLDNEKNLIENGAGSDFYKFYYFLFLFFIKKIKVEFNIIPFILFDDFFLSLDRISSKSLLSYLDNEDFVIISQHESFDLNNRVYEKIILE